VDLAFVLKTLPCLEQVNADASQGLLAGLKARYIAVSYPVASLSGRAKGMPDQYRANFLAMADEQGWQVEELAITGELVFLIKN
jgi:16S rRNA (guanine(1405)-N(7))-methyltransferase